MYRLLSFAFIGLFLVPFSASAADASINRRDGFLLLWQSIQRALVDTRETPFDDVQSGSKGFAEITYAKARGIVDDDDVSFYPDLPLRLDSALLWLFRTRSVDDIDMITNEQLPDLLARYPIANLDGHDRDPLTREQLLTLMRSLDAKLVDEVHEVSNYGIAFQGKGTAFGETFNMFSLTAAHRTFPYNTLVKVTNMNNGKSVTVRINDRGPFVKGRDMDLSSASFEAISGGATGILHATFERLGDADLVTGCGRSPVYQQRITRDVRLLPGIPWHAPLGESVTWKSTQPYVLLGITYPDGNSVKMQNWIFPDESYTFEPSVTGEYRFLVGTKEGRKRVFQMAIADCQRP